jgi:cyclophilin family peptidyl-prolyl cis-trans isomerase/protein-disulfide isomerase
MRKGWRLLQTVLLFILAACGTTATPVPPTPAVVRQIVTVTPRPTESALAANDHARGDPNAYLTITQYCDFQIPVCAELARTLLVVQQRNPVRIVWRHFPQRTNDKAVLAAQASEAAAAQGKFWELHDVLLADQINWIALPVDQFRVRLSQYAQQVGIPDLAAFDAALSAGQYAGAIELATSQALAQGLIAAPVLQFNGEPYSGRIDEFALESYARLRMLETRHFDSQPPLQIDISFRYTATLVTAKGNVVIELFPRLAPAAVNNFVFLARQGWYDNITFHLVRPDLVETGDPSGSGLGTAGYTIFDERLNGLKFDQEGRVAMSSQPGVANSASSRFFISLRPLRPVEFYDGQYTIFGQVIEGMDVLRSLTERDPFDQLRFPNPPPGDGLIRVIIRASGTL